MKEIPLNHGKVAIVDDADYEHLASARWRADGSHGIWYAIRNVKLADDDPRRVGTRTQTIIAMHTVIMNAPQGKQVDHINGNGLDNRRSNLRVVGHSENQQNRHRLTTNTSGYRGVTWNKQSQKWQAGIKRMGKSRHLGLHETPEAAARAYDAAALLLYGPQARLNFPGSEGAIKSVRNDQRHKTDNSRLTSGGY